MVATVSEPFLQVDNKHNQLLTLACDRGKRETYLPESAIGKALAYRTQSPRAERKMFIQRMLTLEDNARSLNDGVIRVI